MINRALAGRVEVVHTQHMANAMVGSANIGAHPYAAVILALVAIGAVGRWDPMTACRLIAKARKTSSMLAAKFSQNFVVYLIQRAGRLFAADRRQRQTATERRKGNSAYSCCRQALR